MKKLAKTLMLVAPLLLSCGPPSPTDDTADSAAVSTLEADCELFCGGAVECSEAFAADWEFDSAQGCIDYCPKFINGAIAFSNDPVCEDTTRAMLVCAGTIQTCEDFEWFEDAAFGTTGLLGKPCADELIEFLGKCN